MIKLERVMTPILLSPKVVAALTQQFIYSGKSVWNNDKIKKVLKYLSNSKCAYCECDLTKSGAYMEVDHFADKSNYPNKVMEWDNLIPSCKRCNAVKGAHDVVAEPIINPFLDQPKDHLALRMFFIVHKSDLGNSTIACLNLNDFDKLLKARFKIATEIINQLTEIKKSYDAAVLNKKPNEINSTRNRLIKIIQQCMPNSEFCGIAANALYNDKRYIYLRSNMIKNCHWSDDLIEYDARCGYFSLDDL